MGRGALEPRGLILARVRAWQRGDGCPIPEALEARGFLSGLTIDCFCLLRGQEGIGGSDITLDRIQG